MSPTQSITSQNIVYHDYRGITNMHTYIHTYIECLYVFKIMYILFLVLDKEGLLFLVLDEEGWPVVKVCLEVHYHL